MGSTWDCLASMPNMTGQRFHRTTEVIPRRPWKSKTLKSLLLPGQSKIGNEHRDAKGTREVRRGTSSIHFHRTVPRSSSHVPDCSLGMEGPREVTRGSLMVYQTIFKMVHSTIRRFCTTKIWVSQNKSCVFENSGNFRFCFLI